MPQQGDGSHERGQWTSDHHVVVNITRIIGYGKLGTDVEIHHSRSFLVAASMAYWRGRQRPQPSEGASQSVKKTYRSPRMNTTRWPSAEREGWLLETLFPLVRFIGGSPARFTYTSLNSVMVPPAPSFSFFSVYTRVLP